MCRVKLCQLYVVCAIIFILFCFTGLSPSTLHLSELIAIILFTFILFQSIGNKQMKMFVVPKYIIFTAVIMTGCVLTGSIWGKYSQMYTIVFYFVITGIALLLENSLPETNMGVGRIQNSLLGIIAYLLFFATVVLEILAKQNIRFWGITIFYVIEDKNLLSMFVFLFFLYANKLHRWEGILFCWYFALNLNKSRGFYLVLILFYFVFIFKKIIYDIVKKIGMTKLLLVLLALTVVLSYIWVFIVSVNGYTDYQVSLNDKSNYMRMVSNIRVVSDLVSVPDLLLWGVGDYLKEFMGITGSVVYTTMYMGVRLVTPHNILLDVLIRMGVVPGFCYIFVLSKVLGHFMVKDNLPYLLPYLANAMLLNQIMDGKWLILFVLVLLTPAKSVKKDSIVRRLSIGRHRIWKTDCYGEN